jgi:hypothetical protein
MAMITRLYLLGVGVAMALCVAAIAFPEVPPTLMLGLLGGTFLALASRTHRYAQAQQAEGATDGRIASSTAGRARKAVTESPITRECGRDLAVPTP